MAGHRALLLPDLGRSLRWLPAVGAAVAAVAVAATTEMGERFWLGGGGGTERKISKKPQTKKSRKTYKKLMRINTNVNFGGASQKWMSPSHSERKTILIDLCKLCSNPYD